MKRKPEKELHKVTANLTVKKITDGYADCNVRLIAAGRKGKQRPTEQH